MYDDGKIISSKEVLIEGKAIPVTIVGDGGQISKVIIASDQVRELVYWWIGRAIAAPVRGLTVIVRNTIVFSVEEWEETITGAYKAKLKGQIQRSADIFDTFSSEILRIQDGNSPEALKEIYFNTLKNRMQERLDSMK
jgi:hypothetical protein